MSETDKFGTPKGNGVCGTCGGLGVLRCKPWERWHSETMTCPNCDSEVTEERDDRLSAKELAAMQPALP